MVYDDLGKRSNLLTGFLYHPLTLFRKAFAGYASHFYYAQYGFLSGSIASALPVKDRNTLHATGHLSAELVNVWSGHLKENVYQVLQSFGSRRSFLRMFEIGRNISHNPCRNDRSILIINCQMLAG